MAQNNTSHKIRNWKGSVASYNFLKERGSLDPWTKYFVVYSGETSEYIVEFLGENRIQEDCGQLYPVNSIVSTAPSVSDVNPYDRFLVGSDGEGYIIYEYLPKALSDGTYELVATTKQLDDRYGVRVRSEGLKNYVYFQNKLISYDDVNCGTF